MSVEQTGDSSVAQAPKKRGRPLRWLAGCVVLFILVVFLVAGVAAGSFLRFSNDVISMTPPDDTSGADGIIVLTGASQRIDRAVQLLDGGNAERLLITGVNPATTGEQIQRLTSAEPTLFECCVDIGHDAIDTRGNANEAALWIRENSYETIIVVTSNYHMPRSLMELRLANTETHFIAYPVINHDYSDLEWMQDPVALRMLLSEYGKFVIARLRHEIGQDGADGLRSSIRTDSAAPKKARLSQEN